MTSKRRENINLVSFICLSFLVISFSKQLLIKYLISRFKMQMCSYCGCNISNTSDGVSSGYPNTKKRVENTTRSGVFLTKFEVFG